MASKALKKFYRNVQDADRVIASHSKLNHPGPGRRALGHLTRGGVLLLCASWELYAESVMIEALEVVLQKTTDVHDLPKPVRKRISQVISGSKHELAPLKMAGDGWKQVLRSAASAEVERLNTPNSSNLNALYRRYLGETEISSCWTLGQDEVDRFVRIRGDIAHRGRDAGYVAINHLEKYLGVIRRTAIDTDNYLPSYLRDLTGERMPWNRTNTS